MEKTTSNIEADSTTGVVLIVSVVIICVLLSIVLSIALYRRNSSVSNAMNRQVRHKDRLSKLGDSIRDEESLVALLDKVLNYIADATGVNVQAFYAKGEHDELRMVASYAYSERKRLSNVFKLGEGIVGQCAKERKFISISDVPDGYVEIESGLGSARPRYLCCYPVEYDNEILGVLELGFVKRPSHESSEFLKDGLEQVSIAVASMLAKEKLQTLLDQANENEKLILAKNEELNAQQEELKASNQSLAEQTQALQESEEELKQQSEELRASNEELEEKQRILQEQTDQLEKSRRELETKASELGQASQYKSDFLANMSHELRTPLNSLLILSQSLAKNKKGNLTEQQVKDAQFIHNGGKDLLNLINDILDLSKVEAGKLDILVAPVMVSDVATNIDRLFRPFATQKGLDLIVDIDPGVADKIESDSQRLEQILKNFMSNALKFTEQGGVTLSIRSLGESEPLPNVHGPREEIVAWSVTDTGIGISEEKQSAIFEAFTQEDGSTSRKYGGTGLGLTISRELARLLGGDVGLKSVVNEGSSFTLFLPVHFSGERSDQVEFLQEDVPASGGSKDFVRSSSKPVEPSSQPSVPKPVAPKTQAPTSKPPSAARQMGIRNRGKNKDDVFDTWIPDDRRSIHSSDLSVLIIEDDFVFANTLAEVSKEKGFRVLVANKGREGLLLAVEHQPTGILLDAGLPDIDGREVLEQLKYNMRTRHIPVHMISGRDYRRTALNEGAISFKQKPVDESELDGILQTIESNDPNRVRRVLLMEDDEAAQVSVQRLLESPDVDVLTASTASDGVKLLDENDIDCIILDLGLPDYNGTQLMRMISAHDRADGIPIIIYTGRSVTADEHKVLTEFSDSIVIKGVESPERLLDEVSLFLHQMGSAMPEDQQAALAAIHDEDAMLDGRRVLVVDDNPVNVYALQGQFENVGMLVDVAENGEMAVNMVQATVDNPDEAYYDVILMDIMMPIMDGYEAMKVIRKIREYRETPILSLTAKAMPGDRLKCIEAGASDYITKPIDIDRLFSMLRVWLYNGRGISRANVA